MRFYLILQLAIAADSPNYALLNQKKVYGHASPGETTLNFIDRVYSYRSAQDLQRYHLYNR